MADTSWNLGAQYDGASGTDANASAVNMGAMVLLTNKSGGDLVTGDVVVLNTAADASVTTTTTAADLRPVYVVPQNVTGANVAASKTVAADEAGWFYKPGAIVPAAHVTATTAIGEYLTTSATAKKLAPSGVSVAATTVPPSGACAIALEDCTGAADIKVMLLGKSETFGIVDKTEKTAVVGDDLVYIADSGASNAPKKAKVENLRKMSMCVCTDANNQTAAAASMTAITFATEVLDTDGYHSTSSNQSRFVAPVAGLYLVHARAVANGDCLAPRIYVDGAAATPTIADGTTGTTPIATALIYLNASQYVELYIRGSSSDRTINPSFFAIVLLSGGA